MIPYVINGQVVNAKLRTVPPAKKDFRTLVPGVGFPLFDADRATGSGHVLLCEGELDCIVLSQQCPDMVSVSLPGGAGTFGEATYDVLVRQRRVHLCLDPDKAGNEGCANIAARLGEDVCYRVSLPHGQDVTDYFLAGATPADFEGLVEAAEPVGDPLIYPVMSRVNSTVLGEDAFPLPEGIPGLADLVGPIPRGSLVEVMGVPGSGKTSFVLQWILEIALRRGHRGQIIELELNDDQVRQKLCACYWGSMGRDVDVGKLVEEDYARMHADFVRRGVKLDLCSPPDELGVEQIKEVMEMAVRRNGAMALMIDHVHFMCRSLEPTAEVDNVTRELKLFAKKFGVLVIAVAHPRKIMEGHAPGIQDLKYAGAGDCDVLLSIYRNAVSDYVGDGSKAKEAGASMDEKALLTVCKTRFGPGGRITSRFDAKRALFAKYHK